MISRRIPFGGVPAGLVGLAANLLICVAGSLAVTRSRRSDEVGVGA